MRQNITKLKTLIMMQLKDLLDLSFFKSRRSTIIKTVVSILKFAAVSAIFYILFMVCNLLSVFYPVGYIPDTAINVLFTLIQLMSIITCTVGLTKTLYMTMDNRVLLTFPVSPTLVYVSKLTLYYIFELRKNIMLTLPLFIAYGMINKAAWYFYPWLIFCFLVISLVPVAIGAIISIPTLYIWQLTKRIKWLQAGFTIIGASAVAALIILIILRIPTNIDIMGQWYAITLSLQSFLNKFAKIFVPYYYLTLMMVGGTLRIGSNLIMGDTLMYLAVTVAGVAALLGLSFLVAKPLFVKMASKAFEYEKKVIPPKKNKTHGAKLSPFVEAVHMDIKSTVFIIGAIVQLVLPAIAMLLVNKLYGAMNTTFSGLNMTKAFNFLIMLVMTLAFNNAYATVYSKEAAARNLLKTRPIEPIYILTSKILLRACIIILSSIGAMITFMILTDYPKEVALMSIITLIVAEAHLLWCAEMDLMNNYAAQYQTLGVFDSPNERNATVVGFILAALFTVLFYFLWDRGTESALIKCIFVALAFFAVRVYLFVMRAKLYFKEK